MRRIELPLSVYDTINNLPRLDYYAAAIILTSNDEIPHPCSTQAIHKEIEQQR